MTTAQTPWPTELERLADAVAILREQVDTLEQRHTQTEHRQLRTEKLIMQMQGQLLTCFETLQRLNEQLAGLVQLLSKGMSDAG